MTERYLVERIADYLTSGGLFNPELMDPMAVRDLLLECRDALQAARAAAPAEPPPEIWPIAKLKVEDDPANPHGDIVTATLYAPGLPPGEFDVYLGPPDAAPAEPVAEVVIEGGRPRWSWLVPDGVTPTLLPDGRHKLYASPPRSTEAERLRALLRHAREYVLDGTRSHSDVFAHGLLTRIDAELGEKT